MSGFFDRFEKFQETSTVASALSRLNFRYDHIIAANADKLRDLRVLDIASHDGRFTLAAIQGAGAAHVHGIEARDHLVANAVTTFKSYGIASDRYTFTIGDVYDVLPTIEAGSIDTVMCLGFLYHTARHFEFFAQMKRIGARHLILDSNVVKGATRPVVLMKWESTHDDSMIFDAEREQVLSAQPSELALTMFMQEAGYAAPTTLEPTAAPKLAGDYTRHERITMVGSRTGIVA